MLIVNMALAVFGAIVSTVFLWPYWGWWSILFSPLGGSFMILLFALTYKE